MRIIAVDDEKIALEALAGAIKAIVAEDEVVTFRYPEDALGYAKERTTLGYSQSGPECGQGAGRKCG